MDSENINVTGDDFVTLGDIADKNSVAYSFSVELNRKL